MGPEIAGAEHLVWPINWFCHYPKEMSEWGPTVVSLGKEEKRKDSSCYMCQRV